MAMHFGKLAGLLMAGSVLALGQADAAKPGKKPVVKPAPAKKTDVDGDGQDDAKAPKDTGADLVVGDFERGAPGWIAVGPAFGGAPVMGAAELKKLGIENAVGVGVASSAAEGDDAQGTLTSGEIRLDRRYLTFRISGGDFERVTCLDLLVNGRVVRSQPGTGNEVLQQVTWDLQPWAGQKARLRLVDAASVKGGHLTVDQIVLTNTPGHLLVTAPLYEEKWRPQFHFTARQWTVDRPNPGQRQEGWLNDLNGLIYYDGEYHLFAQRWNKCWIHAVSKDLVHWKELEPAFWEEKLDSGVQSGTCVVDYKNTSGLGSAGAPPLVAFWSRQDNRSQCLSYSLDKGRTWKLYDKNPVLERGERDPKVFWHEPTQRWVMVMYGDKAYHVLTSANLLEWKDEQSAIPDSFECPDLFELPVDGKKDEKKWVLVRGDGKYSLGDFDGTKFSGETPQLACDVGPNFYATQTWENTRTGDGRRVQVAWMRGGKYPDMPFNQQVSFPCELSLRTTPNGVRLFREPVKEIASLHGESFEGTALSLQPGAVSDLMPPTGANGEKLQRDLLHIKAKVSIPEGGRVNFNLRGVIIGLTAKVLIAGETKTPVTGEIRSVEILLDRTSVEVFVNGGELSYTTCMLPQSDELTVKAEGQTVEVPEMKVYALKSA
ncbi:MAG: sacC, partial [Akkermansiaceae bacterium]|nr:sacC [Akkermansiaceae bacterium]